MRIEDKEACSKAADAIKDIDKSTKLTKALELAINRMVQAGDKEGIQQICQQTGIQVQQASKPVKDGIEFVGLIEEGQNAGLFLYQKKEAGKIKKWLIDPEDKNSYDICLGHCDEILKDAGNRSKYNIIKMRQGINADGTMKSSEANRDISSKISQYTPSSSAA